MVFKESDSVRIKSLHKRGTIVSHVKGNLYKVALGSMVMTCDAADLELVDQPPPLERSSHQPMPVTTRNYSRERKSIESVDLHGFNVRDAIDRVTDAVDKAILLGLEQIEVIHGYGSGKVRDGVHEHLKTLSVVKSFKIDEFNSGKTRVYL